MANSKLVFEYVKKHESGLKNTYGPHTDKIYNGRIITQLVHNDNYLRQIKNVIQNSMKLFRI